jgi:hypothetical protein
MVAATFVTAGQVLVEWDASYEAYADGVMLERRYSWEDDSGFVVVANKGASDDHYYDNSVGPGPMTLVYRIRAYNVTGYSAYSDVGSVFIPLM